MSYHKLIPQVHASFIIRRGKHLLSVRLPADPIIPVFVSGFPAGRLVFTRNGHKQAGIRMLLTEENDFFRGERIESQRAAAEKPSVSLQPTGCDYLPKTGTDQRFIFRRNHTMTSKAYAVLLRPGRNAIDYPTHRFSVRQGKLRSAPGPYRTGASSSFLPSVFPTVSFCG